MTSIFLDGRYFKVNSRIVDVFTPGIFKAKGVFETMLGIDGCVLGYALHMKRLRQGLKILKISVPRIDQNVLRKLLRSNNLFYARVRLMVWQEGKHTHVLAATLPYKVSVKKEYRVCLLKTDRCANDRSARVKSLDYALFAKAHSLALANGFDEALLLNRRGFIFEASRANIFWVKDHILFTPPLSSGCLNGITRQQVIEQARGLKIPFSEKNLTLRTLKEADSAFLTNSLLGIKPIDNTTITDISARV